MFLAAQQRLEHVARVLQGMIEVHNLNGRPEAIFSHLGQTRRAVQQQHHLSGQAQPTADGFPTQQGAKLLDRTKGRYVGGRIVVAQRMALLVGFRLGKHAAQIGHARFGTLVSLLALSPRRASLRIGTPVASALT